MRHGRRHASAAVTAALVISLAACGNGTTPVDIGSASTTTETSPSSTAATTTLAPTTTQAPTTTRRPATTLAPVAATRPPVATSSTTGRTPCSAAVLSVTVATDKAVYRPGETVQASATLRNSSLAPCYYASYTGGGSFETVGGQPVKQLPVFIADAFTDRPLDPGATLTQNPTWDQQVCATNCSQAPPGTYRVRVSWGFAGPPIEGSATFRLAP